MATSSLDTVIINPPFPPPFPLLPTGSLTTTDGSRVDGSSWRTKNDDPVAVSLATARVSLDVQFDALVQEGNRRR